MKVDYNPYEGREVTGATDTVISRGKVVIDGGKFDRPRRSRIGGGTWPGTLRGSGAAGDCQPLHGRSL